MKRIIIHCGMPHTGAHRLQWFFVKNREFMRRNYNMNYFEFSYPENVEKGDNTYGNGDILAKAYFSSHRKGSLTTFANSITNTVISQIVGSREDVLISSQLFSTLRENELGMLLALLSSVAEIQLVYFVRNQYDLWDHVYTQSTIHAGNTLLPSEYFSETLDKFLGDNDYHKKFTALLEVIPQKTALSIIPYEILTEENISLNQIFLKTLGVDGMYLHPIPNKNKKISPDFLKLCLMFNKSARGYPVQGMLQEIMNQGNHFIEGSDLGYLPEECSKVMSDKIYESNNLFFKDFFNSENKYAPMQQQPVNVDAINISNELTVVSALQMFMHLDKKVKNLPVGDRFGGEE